jgi:uncharacterized membrane protein (UPF0127 family)
MRKRTLLDPLLRKGAGECRLVNAQRGAVLASRIEPAFDARTRKKGLLGRESIPDDYALVIAPCNAVHTFFMRCEIDAVFVSRDGTVVKACRKLKPWRIAGSIKAFAVIEAAPGFVDRHQIAPGEVLALRENAPGQQPTDAPPALAPARTAEQGAVPPSHTT